MRPVAAFQAAHRAARAREPVARADFDLYLDGATLTYVKDGCTVADPQEKFFLHLIPAHAADLPALRREQGFDNLDFYFWEVGARRDGACVAVVALPDYEFAGIRTGQFISGQGQLWSAAIALPAAARTP